MFDIYEQLAMISASKSRKRYAEASEYERNLAQDWEALLVENARLKVGREQNIRTLARQAVELERLQEIEIRYRLRISELKSDLADTEG
jgi:hypothetical protein